MDVTVSVKNYPGLSEVTIDLGLGHAPRNTSRDTIAKTLRSIPGIDVENVGGLRAHEGVWGVNRRTARRNPHNFTTAEMAKIKETAERIAAKG